jgi:hypothetical protein
VSKAHTLQEWFGVIYHEGERLDKIVRPQQSLSDYYILYITLDKAYISGPTNALVGFSLFGAKNPSL